MGGTGQQWVEKQGRDLYHGTAQPGPSESRIMLHESLGMSSRVKCAGRDRS